MSNIAPSHSYSKTRFALYFVAPTLISLALFAIGEMISTNVCTGYLALSCGISFTLYLMVGCLLMAVIGQIILAKQLALHGSDFYYFVLPVFMLALLPVILIGLNMVFTDYLG